MKDSSQTIYSDWPYTRFFGSTMLESITGGGKQNKAGDRFSEINQVHVCLILIRVDGRLLPGLIEKLASLKFLGNDSGRPVTLAISIGQLVTTFDKVLQTIGIDELEVSASPARRTDT